jgi:hypothetical protein
VGQFAIVVRASSLLYPPQARGLHYKLTRYPTLTGFAPMIPI